MSSIIEHIDLLEGLNLNPIPIEFSQEVSTTKWLCAIQAKVNNLIDIGNAWEVHANQYTDDEVAKVQKEYNDLMALINAGNIIPNGSIALEKLKPTFLTDLQELILKYVHNSSKFVTFGIDKNGYFFADIPETWNEIAFSTDVEGHLCLDIIN